MTGINPFVPLLSNLFVVSFVRVVAFTRVIYNMLAALRQFVRTGNTLERLQKTTLKLVCYHFTLLKE